MGRGLERTAWIMPHSDFMAEGSPAQKLKLGMISWLDIPNPQIRFRCMGALRSDFRQADNVPKELLGPATFQSAGEATVSIWLASAD